MNSEGGQRPTDGSIEIEAEQDVTSTLITLHTQEELFQLEEYKNTVRKSKDKKRFTRLFSKCDSVASALTVDDMLVYQQEPLLVPLLVSSASCSSKALKMFNAIQGFLKSEKAIIASSENLVTIRSLLHMGLSKVELKDELFMQVLKQSRKNDDEEATLRTWILFLASASAMPPSKQYVSLLSHYIHEVCHDQDTTPDIKRMATSTWQALKRTVKAGPRVTLPSLEEIHVLLSSNKMKTSVFFLDNTFEDLYYNVSTTVADAVEQIAQIIDLENYQTFSLFESLEHVEDHVLLEDNRYIADILVEFNTNAKRDPGTHKLVFRKKIFMESDDDIFETQFLNLSFVQAQHDFLLGNYPVVYEDAAQLCALQLFSEFGTQVPGEERPLKKAIERFTSKEIRIVRSREEWKEDVLLKYTKLKCRSPEEARYCFLTLLRSLPYGSSVFFHVNRLDDPIGLLPPKLILGINKHGIHFFRPVPKEYLHSVELRDIMQFGSSFRAVFLKMRVASVLHVFQFETTRGEDICMAIQTHINDIMVKRYKATADYSNLQLSHQQKLPEADFGSEYEQHLAKTKQSIDEAAKEEEELRKSQANLVYENECANAKLQDILQHMSCVKSETQQQRHQVKQAEKEVSYLESELETTTRALTTCRALLAEDQSKKADIQSSIRAAEVKTLEVQQQAQQKQSLLDRLSHLKKEESLTENKIARIEKERDSEIFSLRKDLEEVTLTRSMDSNSQDIRIASLVEEIGNITAMHHENEHEIENIQKDQQDFVVLKRMKEAIQKKDKEFVSVIKKQKERITAAESMYQKEKVMRKKIYNKVEDLKGKIRVFARVRPVLDIEKKRKQKAILSLPDELTVSHSWKRDDCPREYAFDRVFGPTATQTEVFKDTHDLIQSAIDGYNVCVFAYGQTGSGKTYTIYGNERNPGLAPQGIEKLFELLLNGSDKHGFSVSCYMLELYQNTLMDLLSQKTSRASELPRMSDNRRVTDTHASPNKERLEIKRDTSSQMVKVQGLTQVQVHSAEELKMTFEAGQTRRHVAATNLNIESSRSHLIMGIVIETTDLQTQIQTKGKLSFVDLAGSERIKKSGSAGEQLKEAQAINGSLSALGDVISSLARGDSHTPYRNHKLTMLMSDSLGGNAKTLMFVNVSPTDANLDETQNSLQYAMRVRTIKNEGSKDSNKDLISLKKKVSYWRTLSTAPGKNEVQQMIAEYL